MKNFILPEDLLVGILTYLGSRPHREVRHAVAALEQHKVVEPEQKKDDKPAEVAEVKLARICPLQLKTE